MEMTKQRYIYIDININGTIMVIFAFNIRNNGVIMKPRTATPQPQLANLHKDHGPLTINICYNRLTCHKLPSSCFSSCLLTRNMYSCFDGMLRKEIVKNWHQYCTRDSIVILHYVPNIKHKHFRIRWLDSI